MARVTRLITLNLRITPALTVLVEAAQEIAARHGEDRASEWAHRVIQADPDLFCEVEEAMPAPKLRLIVGGRDD